MSTTYYDKNAEAYIRSTINEDMSAARARFLRHVIPCGHILDAGCGSGRDARAFAQAGYTVAAFDGSAAMARLAAAYAALPVLHLTFEHVAWRDAFDGIWASASLLHVPRTDLPTVTDKLASALRQGGALYVSLKSGSSDREVDGRHFTDVTEPEIERLLTAAGLRLADLWSSADVRAGRTETWVNAIGRRSEA